MLARSVVSGRGADVVGSTACELADDARRGAVVGVAECGGAGEGAEETVMVTRTVVVAVTVASTSGSVAGPTGAAWATPSFERGAGVSASASATVPDGRVLQLVGGWVGSSPRARRCAPPSRVLFEHRRLRSFVAYHMRTDTQVLTMSRNEEQSKDRLEVLHIRL